MYTCYYFNYILVSLYHYVLFLLAYCENPYPVIILDKKKEIEYKEEKDFAGINFCGSG